jgi:uncharacterized membrane protein HdeD (DUF308 family)
VTRAWAVIAVRAALALAAGVLMLARPGMGLSLLFAMLGVYLVCDGALALAMLAEERRHGNGGRFWPYLVEGLLSIAVGLLAFARPGALKVALLSLVGVRFLITGGVELAAGARLRRESGGRPWLPWLAGIASLAFGAFLLARPAAAGVVLVWLAGIYLVLFGIGLAGTALRLRRDGTRRAAA